MKRNEFNNFRFGDMGYKIHTIRYMTMNRVNEDKTKVVVKVDPRMLYKTKFGYAMHLNEKYVIYLKEWQVDMNPDGCEILLNKDYFKPVEYGFSRGYQGYDHLLNWDTWVRIATKQDAALDLEGNKANEVKWMIRSKLNVN